MTEAELGRLMREQARLERKHAPKHPIYNMRREIVRVMSDGRERTIDDLATKLNVQVESLNTPLASLARAGVLHSFQMSDGFGSYTIYRQAKNPVSQKTGSEACCDLRTTP